MANKNSNVRPTANLTRGTKKLISKAIEETGSLNNHVLFFFITEDLCSKFSGDSLTYQLKRMGLETTMKVSDSIDAYIYRHSKNKEVVIGVKSREGEDE